MCTIDLRWARMLQIYLIGVYVCDSIYFYILLYPVFFKVIMLCQALSVHFLSFFFFGWRSSFVVICKWIRMYRVLDYPLDKFVSCRMAVSTSYWQFSEVNFGTRLKENQKFVHV
jgi:hypothetical protein